MRDRSVRPVLIATAVTAFLFVPDAALAYGGPGSIVSGIGALLAAVAAIAAAVVGFFWFPLKRLIERLRGGRQDDEDDVAEAV